MLPSEVQAPPRGPPLELATFPVIDPPETKAWPPASTALTATPPVPDGFFMSLMPIVLPSDVSNVTVGSGPDGATSTMAAGELAVTTWP